MPIFFDTHAHLDYPEYEKDFSEVLVRAQNAGITKIISIGTSLDSSRRAIALAEKFPAIYAAVGWHPGEALTAPQDLRPALRELARHPKVVAIGETGLDYYRLPSSQGRASVPASRLVSSLAPPNAEDLHYKKRQAEIFQQQLEVAAEFNLNAVIHQRASFDDTLAQLKPFAGKVRGVFHCFTESMEVARAALDLGFHISFSGILTFKTAAALREVARYVPLDRCLIETDSPYLAPVPHRGKTNTPAWVPHVAQLIAELKGVSAATVADATHFTFEQLFRVTVPEQV